MSRKLTPDGFPTIGSKPMRIAFYAPLKPPDHPVPSGDRQMARLLVRALGLAGHTVVVASQLRSFRRDPTDGGHVSVNAAAIDEIERLAACWTSTPPPDLWFCYHPYYKAPDLIGPALADRFGFPYVTAEASYSSRRNVGAWAPAQEQVVRAVRQAALNICFTGRDLDGLSSLVAPDRLSTLPPFIDTAPFVDRRDRVFSADARDDRDDATRRQDGELSHAGAGVAFLLRPAVAADRGRRRPLPRRGARGCCRPWSGQGRMAWPGSRTGHPADPGRWRPPGLAWFRRGLWPCLSRSTGSRPCRSLRRM